MKDAFEVQMVERAFRPAFHFIKSRLQPAKTVSSAEADSDKSKKRA